VVGDEASLFLDDPWHVDSPSIELRRETEPERITVEHIPVELANAYRLELENASEAICGEVPVLLGRDDAIGRARVLEALYQSAQAGAPVELF
jgi:predicted dehydrogenase